MSKKRKNNKKKPKRKRPVNLSNLKIVDDKKNFTLNPRTLLKSHSPVRPSISRRESTVLDEKIKKLREDFDSYYNYNYMYPDIESFYYLENDVGLSNYLFDLREYLQENIFLLMNDDYYWAAFELIIEALSLINKHFNNKINITILEQVEEIANLVSFIYARTDEQFYQDSIDYLLSSLNRFISINNDTMMEDLILGVPISKNLSTDKEIEAQQNFIDASIKLYEYKKQNHPTPWTDVILGRLYAHLVHYPIGIPEKYIRDYKKCYQKYKDYPAVFSAYAAYLRETGRLEECVDLILEEREERKDDFSFLSIIVGQTEYSSAVAQTLYYMLYNNVFYRFNELFKYLLEDNQYGQTVQDIALMYKEYGNPEEWQEIIDFLIENSKIDIFNKASLLNVLGEMDLLADLVLDHSDDPLLFDSYFPHLFELYPERTAKKYIEFLKILSHKAKNRKDYRRLVDHLDIIKTDFKDGEQYAQELNQYFRSEFKRKRALKDELNKAGYK